ncbi:MAG: hypothetical protein ABWZ76_10960 [Acidimicrobiales bacterium]
MMGDGAKRIRWLLIGVAATVLPMGVTTGLDGGGGMIFALVISGVALLGLAALAARPGRRAAGGWTPSGPFAFVAAGPPGQSGAWPVARALGRAEARQLLPGSLALGAGIGFCLLTILLFGIVWSADHGGQTAELAELFPAMVHPLAGMTILATHRARTRGRRDDLEELFSSCPTTQSTRSLGHLATAWVPALLACTFAAGLFVSYLLSTDVHWGGFGARQVSHLVGAVLLPVGAVAVGVALARVAPWTLAPVVAVVAIGLASIQLSTSGVRSTDPSRNLSTWLTDTELPIRFTETRWAAHHLWILALVVAMVLVALLIDSPSRRRLVVALAGVAALAVVAGVAATRPIDASGARRIASLVGSPDLHQSCVDAGIRVCTYAGDDELGDAFADHVRAVVAAAPGAPAPDLEIRQGAAIDRHQLDPMAASLIAPAAALPSLPIDVVAYRDAYEGARFWTALGLVGVLEPAHLEKVHDLRGQARGVLAIWLATRGLDGDRAMDMSSPPQADEPWDDSRPWPDECYAGPAPVTWALTDLEAARQLIAAPEEDVRHVLEQSWATLVDPATSTDVLLVRLGLDPLGPPQNQTPGPVGC